MNKKFLGLALGLASMATGDYFYPGKVRVYEEQHNSLGHSKRKRKKRKNRRRIASRMRALNRRV